MTKDGRECKETIFQHLAIPKPSYSF